jgi:hypothetical protein
VEFRDVDGMTEAGDVGVDTAPATSAGVLLIVMSAARAVVGAVLLAPKGVAAIRAARGLRWWYCEVPPTPGTAGAAEVCVGVLVVNPTGKVDGSWTDDGLTAVQQSA